MKIQNILTIISLASILLFNACSEDFLDVQPAVSENAESDFNDPIKVAAFMTGIYDRTQLSNFTLQLILHSDVKGEDIFVISSGNFGRFVASYQYSEDPYNGYQYDFWRNGYAIIANCNQLISKLPNAGNLDEDLRNHYLAEARTLRANTYFQLVRLFGQPYSVAPTSPGVPLTLAPLGADDDFPGRATVNAVYTEILNDLEFAEANFEVNVGNSINRITLPSIRGLLARVHLNMGNWVNARDYAINARAGYSVMSAVELNEGFADANSEWMWALNMREDDNSGYLMIPSFYDLRTLGYSSFRADIDFYSLFEPIDARAIQFTSNGIDSKISNNGYEVYKFLHRTSWDMSQVLMRASEMYLIEAEAEAELTNYTEARTALNIIRSRAGATLATTGLTGQPLIDQIMIERRKELFGEGFRFFDITRKSQALIRTSTSHWVPLNIPANDPLMVLPIPQDEIDANPNISSADQNEAYR